MRLAIATAPEQDRKTLQLALGWDNEGNMVGSTIPSYSEIGKQIGKTRQRVQQILSQYGITEQVLNQMAAVGQESVGLSEIMPSQQEDGGQHEGTGYRLMTNPNEADDIVDIESGKQSDLNIIVRGNQELFVDEFRANRIPKFKALVKWAY